MKHLFLAITAIVLLAIPHTALATPPEYGTPGDGRVRVLVTGPVRRPGYYWLDPKTSFQAFMERDLAGVRDQNSVGLVHLMRGGKALFIGRHQSGADAGLGVVLQDGDTIAFPFID